MTMPPPPGPQGQPTPPPPPPGGQSPQPGAYPQQTPPQVPQQPGGFPPPGAPLPPAPKKSNTGLFVRIGIVAAVVIVLVVLATTTSIFKGNPTPDPGETSDTNAAEVGSCTDDSMIASSINVVNCNDESAVYRVVAKSDSPDGTESTADQAAKTICAGSTAVTYLYQYDPRGGSLDWLICLEPADGGNTLNYGEIPNSGDCMSDTYKFLHTVDCSNPDASSEVIVASSDVDPTLTDALTAAEETCGQGDWNYYFAGPEATGPFDWVVCTGPLS